MPSIHNNPLAARLCQENSTTQANKWTIYQATHAKPFEKKAVVVTDKGHEKSSDRFKAIYAEFVNEIMEMENALTKVEAVSQDKHSVSLGLQYIAQLKHMFCNVSGIDSIQRVNAHKINHAELALKSSQTMEKALQHSPQSRT